MKSAQMETMLDVVSVAMYGRKRSETMKEKRCVACGGPADSFKDELSVKEFSLSGMCQFCQDSVFGTEEGE